jgi:hypothetical protein
MKREGRYPIVRNHLGSIRKSDRPGLEQNLKQNHEDHGSQCKQHKV